MVLTVAMYAYGMKGYTKLNKVPYIKDLKRYKKLPSLKTRMRCASSYVYILECQGAYKIGIARDVRSRMQTLKTGNPFEIKFVYARLVFSARSLEAALHWWLLNRRIRGEWFMIDKDILKDVIKKIEEFDEDEIWRKKRAKEEANS